MRMTNGLQSLCSDTFYGGLLIPGPGTSVDDPKRGVSLTLKDFFNKVYPDLKREPDDSIFPVLLNVRGECRTEEHGKSRFNLWNVACVLDLARKVIDSGILEADDIGIVTPYNAQVDLYEEHQIRAQFSPTIEVGTAEFFQGREKALVFCDFVRAHNDNGQKGFLAEKRRLNVMLSRQVMHLVIVADTWCTKLSESEMGLHEKFQQAFKEAKKNKTARPTETSDQRRAAAKLRNNYGISDVFKWLEDRGRVVQITQDNVPGEQ